MNVSEVRIKLNLPSTDRLRGCCSVTLDNAFVVRDIKIIDGPNGVFVAMPSRKLMDHCRRCRGKNHLKARYCNTCGGELDENRRGPSEDGRVKLHCDVAHPINPTCRAAVQQAIIKAYMEEVERAKQPGYVPTSLEDFEADFENSPGVSSPSA